MRRSRSGAGRKEAWLPSSDPMRLATSTHSRLASKADTAESSHHIDGAYGNATRGKVRRLEPLAERMVYEEIQRYLEMARQQEQQTPGLSTHRGGYVTADEAMPFGSSSPQPPQDARSHEDSNAVDLAVYETFRILRTCWTFTGRPQDAFEPVRHLSPITLHLLLTYGRHRVTSDGQYVVLSGAEEQMPYVGVLMDCLHRHMQHHAEAGHSYGCEGGWGQTAEMAFVATSPPRPSAHDEEREGSIGSPHGLSPFRASWHTPRAPPVPGASPLPPSTSRLLVTNCHSFGWMDSLANAGYEESGRALQQVNATLKSLLLDPAFAPAGRPRVMSRADAPHLPETSSSTHATDLPSQTVVLLGDAVLMDGGVPSLYAARHGAAVFAAHHQYGRGLACLVPVLPPSHTPSLSTTITTTTTPTSDPSVANNSNNNNTRGGAVESTLPWCGDRDIRSAPALSSAWWDRLELPPLSCGVRTVPGAATAQAVLLSPVGPLVVHVQYQVDGASSEFARLFAAQPHCSHVRFAAPSSSSQPLSPASPGTAGTQYAVQDVRNSPTYTSSVSSEVHVVMPSSASSMAPREAHSLVQPEEDAVTCRTATQEEPDDVAEGASCRPNPWQRASLRGSVLSPRSPVTLLEPRGEVPPAPPPVFTISDLPYALYLGMSGEALTHDDVTAAVAAASAADGSHDLRGAQQEGCAGRVAPTSTKRGRGLAWPESRALTLSSQLIEMVEWLMPLLRSPVPVMLVEWQLRSGSAVPNAVPPSSPPSRPPPDEPYFGMVNGPARASLTHQLCDAYVEGFSARAARRAPCAAPSQRAAAASPFAPFVVGVDRLQSVPPCSSDHMPASSSWTDASAAHALHDVVHDTFAQLVRCPETSQFDGQERPLVFVRGLETMAETEQFANATTVVTSLQYRRR